MARYEAPQTGSVATTPTQVVYPGRAVARTFVASFLGTAITVALLLPEVLKVIDEEFGHLLSPQVRGYLTIASAFAAALAATITRVMAIRRVNRSLRPVHLSATP